MIDTARYTHEDRDGRLCRPLTAKPDEHGYITVECAEHLSGGRVIAPHVAGTRPELIHARVSAPASRTATIRATVGPDWPHRWPCSGFRPGDQVEARFDGRGDLVGVECWRGGSQVYPLDVEAAELGAALATYGEAI